MKPTLASLFPLASKSCADRNPQLSLTKPNKTIPGASSARRRGEMNSTESEFARILEAMKRKGEILRYEFEGITLRWADMRYTPDFFVTVRHCSSMPECHQFKCIEVKGSHIHYRQQAIARFKGCRSFWPEFTFEMWQKQKSGWKQIL